MQKLLACFSAFYWIHYHQGSNSLRLTVQRNHHRWFWFCLFFHFSLSVHIHYLWPPAPAAPSPPLPCYLFGHVARLSSLETHARLSICFLKTLFKIASVVQKNRKNRVGWMKGIRGGQDVTVYIAKWQVICLHISRKFSCCCCCSGSEGPLDMFHLSVLRFSFDKYASRRKLKEQVCAGAQSWIN